MSNFGLTYNCIAANLAPAWFAQFNGLNPKLRFVQCQKFGSSLYSFPQDNGANKRTFNDGYHAIHHINVAP